ncbi:MAG: cobalamin-dependent protein, partial [Acidimicrobiales bacterium]
MNTGGSAAGIHRPVHPVRLVTAASLFDGHDAAINVMRRILQSQGAEVIHLGHNRSVDEIVGAAVEEDVQGVAVSSYQGGHIEYFRYLVDRLRAEGRADAKVFGGGGGVIVPDEIAELHDYGVTHVFSPEDGQRLGLARMVNTIVEACDTDLAAQVPAETVERIVEGDHRALARAITAIQGGTLGRDELVDLRQAAARRAVPVLGVTGTGGSGKSSLADELVRRFRLDHEDKLRIAVVAIDPTRRRAGGALLGDRIRMNAIDHPQVFMRSLATRGAVAEVPEHVDDVIAACKAAGYDVVIVETPGIGQGDTGIVDLVDVSLYVMTPEFGAPSQLEKIDMLDFANAVAINKFERRGADDALRDVRRQFQRNRESFGTPLEDLPVFGTIAARFNDDGVTALYQHLRGLLGKHGLATAGGTLAPVETRVPTGITAIVPPARARYLADVAESVRDHHRRTDEQVAAARRRQALRTTRELLAAADSPAGGDGGTASASAAAEVGALLEDAERALDAESHALFDDWPATVDAYSGDEHVVTVRDREIRTAVTDVSLSGTHVPRVALPRHEAQDEGTLLRWLKNENLPGRFPFTGGVFAFKREGED